MTRHILIPTDGSRLSDEAIKQGIALAKALGAKVTGVHIVPPFHAFTYRAQMLLTYQVALAKDSEAEYNRATSSCAKRLLLTIKRAGAAAGVSCDTVQASSDQPFEAIIDIATKKHCDLILMASHGHAAIGGILLGSETQKVLTHSDIPVLVYR
jgi:nucleotide-binding universal stress UspA family protein